MEYPAGEYWYTICTRPSQELKVREFLLGKDLETILPLQRKRVNNGIKKNGKQKARYRDYPLLPGYLICYADLDQTIKSQTLYYLINTCPGVNGLLGIANRALVMDDEAISPLICMLDDKFYLPQGDALVKDSPVKITEGPFVGHSGTYQGRSGYGMVEIFNEQYFRLTGKHLKISANSIKLAD